MFAIKNAHLISALTEGFEGDYADVVIDHGKFVDILPLGTKFEDMDVFDVGRRTLMPGMFDLHMHIYLLTDDFPLLAAKTQNQIAYEGVRYANEFLRQGFTTIRDCGNPFYIGIAMRDAFAQNLMVGPRMIVAGKCITPYAKGNNSFPELYYEANTEEELLKACRYEHALGTDFLKYMGTGSGANLTGVPGELVSTRKEIFAMQNIAEQLHTTLAVHCHGTEGIKYAAEAGVHTIEHASLIDDECIDILLKNQQRTAIVPTLSPIANTALGEDSGRLPQNIVEKLKYLYSNAENIVRASRAGVMTAWGTDNSMTFFASHPGYEFKARARLGYTNIEMLQQATINSAKVLGLEDKLGTVKVGKLADFIIVDGDPAKDYTVMMKYPDAVYKEGVRCI